MTKGLPKASLLSKQNKTTQTKHIPKTKISGLQLIIFTSDSSISAVFTVQKVQTEAPIAAGLPIFRDGFKKSTHI